MIAIAHLAIGGSVAQLPDNVIEPIDVLGGYFLWLINSLAVVSLTAAAGLFWLEKKGHDVSASQWVVKTIVGVMIAASAADIGAAVIAG